MNSTGRQGVHGGKNVRKILSEDDWVQIAWINFKFKVKVDDPAGKINNGNK